MSQMAAMTTMNTDSKLHAKREDLLCIARIVRLVHCSLLDWFTALCLTGSLLSVGLVHCSLFDWFTALCLTGLLLSV